jgi:nucleoside-diphosphate-sugar epimerase
MASLNGPLLVTGGSGFIGTQLVDQAAKRGLEVVNLDIRPPIYRSHDAFWRNVDLNDAAAVVALVQAVKPRAIFNLAAHAVLEASSQAFAVNYDGPRHLIEGARKLDDPPLIVHVSTQLVTKPGTQTVSSRDLAPYSPYGESKAMAEQVFFGLADDTRWTILRPTNVWGPYHPTFAKAILKYIRSGWYMHPGNENSMRSYGYVENVAYQMLRAAEVEPDAVQGKLFYVGDDPMSAAVWADAFGVALRGRPVRRVPMTLLRGMAALGDLSGKIGGPSPFNSARLERLSTDYAVPMEPTFDVLGRGPVPFEDGVEKTVRWLLTQ